MIQNARIAHFKGLENVALEDMSRVNVLIGKNNAGKSSVLHALDMTGLALTRNSWDVFQLKLELKDLFRETGSFRVELEHCDNHTVVVEKHVDAVGPTFPDGAVDEDRKTRTVLITVGNDMAPIRRSSRAPKQVIDQLENRNMDNFTGIDLLYAIRFYGERNERGFVPDDYMGLRDEILQFFPELEGIESGLDESNVSTLEYTEYDEKRDIMYSGAGLQHIAGTLVKMVVSKADLILLDEPEVSLHPDLQRRFHEFLRRYTEEKDVQVVLTTHAPAFIDAAPNTRVYRVKNANGTRAISPVNREALHSIYGDIGWRPSDLLQPDIVVLVEGRDDVVFFEKVAEEIWRPNLAGVSLTVQQYGGDAAAAIRKGAIDVSNIAAINSHALWIHDRDAKPDEEPSSTTRAFKTALEDKGQKVEILTRREIEFYLPEAALVELNPDKDAQAAARAALQSDQGESMKKLRAKGNFNFPGGAQFAAALDNHWQEVDVTEFNAWLADYLQPMADEIKGI